MFATKVRVRPCSDLFYPLVIRPGDMELPVLPARDLDRLSDAVL